MPPGSQPQSRLSLDQCPVKDTGPPSQSRTQGDTGLAWGRRISSSDIKDKSQLTTARKDVERQMERFKVCEKETKTKAFSKEGLGQVTKMDPREKKRLDMHDWLSTTVLRLNEDVRPLAAP